MLFVVWDANQGDGHTAVGAAVPHMAVYILRNSWRPTLYVMGFRGEKFIVMFSKLCCAELDMLEMQNINFLNIYSRNYCIPHESADWKLSNNVFLLQGLL